MTMNGIIRDNTTGIKRVHFMCEFSRIHAIGWLDTTPGRQRKEGGLGAHTQCNT